MLRGVGPIAIAAIASISTVAIGDPRPGTVEPRPDDLVDVTSAIPDAVLDLRYATKHNFTGEVLYPVARCKLRRAVLARLVRAATALRRHDRRLLIWDCYRPRSIQQALWDRVHDARYVARPCKRAQISRAGAQRIGRPRKRSRVTKTRCGSLHNRGAAIDVGVVDADGRPVRLPTEFDDFTSAAHRRRALAGSAGREARALSKAMLAAGFAGISTEWWHFAAVDAARFAVSDEPL